MATPLSRSGSSSLGSSYEDLSSHAFSGVDEAEVIASEIVSDFHGHSVTVLEGDVAIDTRQLPTSVRTPVTKRWMLRLGSSLLNPVDKLRELTASIGHSERRGIQEGLNDKAETVSCSSGEDGWEDVASIFCTVDIEASLPTEKGCAHIIGEDAQLVRTLGYKQFSSSPARLERLFGPEGPMLRDISQSDERHTCPIHSVMISFLNSPKTCHVVEKMFEEKEGGYVAVTLGSPYGHVVKAVVSKSRVYSKDPDSKDVEIFSSNSEGRAWLSVLEKALLTVNRGNKERYNEICLSEEAPVVSKVREMLQHSMDEDDSPWFDYSDPCYVFDRMPFVNFGFKNPCFNTQIISFDRNYRKTVEQQKRWIQLQEYLLRCIELQIPMVVCTRKLTDETKALDKIKTSFTALKTGTPTGHAMAVIARRGNSILVCDPSGERKGKVTDDMFVNAEFNHFRNGVLQRVALSDIPHRFCMAYLPRGAPQR